MAYIRSANPSNFQAITEPGYDTNYIHGADTRKHYVPLAFQITSPYDINKVLLPHALIAHVNPQSFAETFSKKVERFQTRGGFVEQHWGDELTEISVDQSTGAFMNLYTGLSSILRQRTIAWDRYRDLYDLYRNNGSVYDPYGNIVLQGWVMLIFDRGVYIGTFRTFSVEETDESPFAFKLSWNFKVEHTIQQIPYNANPINPPGAPGFQSQNSTLNVENPQGETYTKRNTRLKAEAEEQAKRQAAALVQAGAEAVSAGVDYASGLVDKAGALLRSIPTTTEPK